jgi:cytochrome c2
MNPIRTTPSFLSLAIAAAIPLGLWITTLGFTSVQRGGKGLDLREGEGIFRDYCGACHVLEKGITTHHGPNLWGVGQFAADRKPGMSAEQYILESILDPDAFVAPQNHRGMPRGIARKLAPETIRNIVAYLASQGAAPDFAAIRRLEIPDLRSAAQERVIRREDMELANQLIRSKAKCLECHTLHRNAEYQVFAPAILAVGLSDPQQLHESVVEPSKVIAPAYLDAQVMLTSGESMTGRVLSRDDKQITLLVRNETNQLHKVVIAMEEVEEEDGKPMIVPAQLSPMPKGLDEVLTPEELRVILLMIEQLN